MLKNKKSSLFYRIIMIIVVLFLTGWIFSNSLQNAMESTQQSEAFTKYIESFINSIVTFFSGSKETIELDRGVIRKLAHFTEFASLGLLTSILVLLFVKKIKYIFFSEIFGLFVALLDETIQLFIEGRAGSLMDCFIDFSGFTFGVLFVFLICLLFQSIQKRKENTKVLDEKL